MKIITETVHSDLKWAIKEKLPFQFDRQVHNIHLQIDYLVATQTPVIFLNQFLLSNEGVELTRNIDYVKDDSSTAQNYKEFEDRILGTYRRLLKYFNEFPRPKLPKKEKIIMPEIKKPMPFSIHLNDEIRAEMLHEAKKLGLKNIAQYIKVLHNLHHNKEEAKAKLNKGYEQSVRDLETYSPGELSA